MPEAFALDPPASAFTLARMTDNTRTQIEEEVVAPAVRFLRRFGIGAAQAIAGVVATFGMAGASVGGLLRLSATNEVVTTLGTIALALGLTAFTFGTAGFFGFRKVKALTDEREVHRRLLALAVKEGSTTDAVAARRLKVSVDEVRDAAEALVREGKLTLDVDTRSGTETYVADEDDLRRRLPAEERIALAAFDTELESASRAPLRSTQRQESAKPTRAPAPRAAASDERWAEEEQVEEAEASVGAVH